VYIVASKRNGTIYTGVTSDLYFRMPQHKQGHPEWIDLSNEETGEILDGPADVARRQD
jgi:predicted GIY-YIG superfamily endonuclease